MKGFVHRQYTFPGSIEHEYYFKGNYGAKGEQRAPKRKKTPEEIREVNQKNKEKRVRHLIKQNFKPGDYFITLNFGNDYKPRSLGSLRKKEIRNFLDRMRRAYKKAETPFKFILRIERGEEAHRPHIHIIMNRINGLDELITKNWTYGGKMIPHFRILTDDPGTPENLAGYMVKESDSWDYAGNLLEEEDDNPYYSTSRNLERPVPKTRRIKSRTMLSIFNHELKPTKGFYIDKNPDTLKRGINPYTGLTYVYYQEIRLKPKQTAPPAFLYECPVCHQMTFEGLSCNCQRRNRGSQHLRRHDDKST